MKIYITTGKGVGRTPISAFDAALKDARVYNYNLVYLSSIIPPDTDIELRKIPEDLSKWGDRLYVVRAEMRSRESGKYIGAALGWCQFEDGRGIFVEHEEIGETKDAVEGNLKEEVRKSLGDMCKARKIQVNEDKFQMILCTTKVKDLPASVLVVAVYKSEDWS